MSAPDPLDQLGAQLFRAAREAPIPEGAMARVLEAAHAGRAAPVARLTRAVKLSLFGAAAALALAASVALLARRHEATDRISAEPSSTLIRRQQQAAPSAPVLAPKSATSAVSSAAPVVSVNAPAPVRSAPVSLSDELDALKVASTALAAGNSSAALAALDQYDHVLKGKKMRAEATLLRIEALSRAGQTEAASALAQQFVDKNPESPLVDRARSFARQ
ncbi:MAG: hypothetical protein ABI548_15125 [Polyangiaceae bacterium]